MKKKILLIVIPLILIISSIVGYFLYQDYRVKHAIKKVVLKTNEVEVFDKVYVSDVIGSINGKLVKDKRIDTTKTGKKKITFEFINNEDIKVDYTIKINVVDKTPPVVKNITRYGIEVGNKDFYKKFFCGDNYDNKPKCSIEGKYDVNTPGEYNIAFKAVDSSRNETVNKFTLIVREKSKTSTKQTEEKKVYTNFKDVVSKYKKKDNKIGLDVSEFQGDIDFDRVKKAGVEFVYIRVGRGGGVGKTPVIDKKFKKNIEGFNKVGIKVGVYFFSYSVSKKEILRDAKWVVKQLKNHKIDLEVAYDFEDWNDYNEYNLSFYNLTEIANTFNDYMKKNGYNGMLYSSKYYLENIWFEQNYPVWLAHYTDKTDYKGKYKVWQICENGKIDGIKNQVDINIRY